MKKLVNILMLAAALALVQACGSKSEKNEEATTDEKVVKTSMPTAEERKAQLRKEKADRLERRKREDEERLKISPTYKDSKGKVVYNKAEVDPTYKGGEEALTKYLNEHIQYPEAAKKRGVEGTVFVDFVIAEDGSVREVVVNDAVGEQVDPDLRNEAIRLVKSMPKWVPGRQRGKAVDVKFSLPITFQLI
jgi:TonB family protein